MLATAAAHEAKQGQVAQQQQQLSSDPRCGIAHVLAVRWLC